MFTFNACRYVIGRSAGLARNNDIRRIQWNRYWPVHNVDFTFSITTYVTIWLFVFRDNNNMSSPLVFCTFTFDLNLNSLWILYLLFCFNYNYWVLSSVSDCWCVCIRIASQKVSQSIPPFTTLLFLFFLFFFFSTFLFLFLLFFFLLFNYCGFPTCVWHRISNLMNNRATVVIEMVVLCEPYLLTTKSMMIKVMNITAKIVVLLAYIFFLEMNWTAKY